MLSSPLASHNIPPECRVRERIKSLNLRLSISAVIFFPPPRTPSSSSPRRLLSLLRRGISFRKGKLIFPPLSFPFRVPSVENEEHPESGSGKRREAGKMKKRQIEGWPFSAGRGTFFPPSPRCALPFLKNPIFPPPAPHSPFLRRSGCGFPECLASPSHSVTAAAE